MASTIATRAASWRTWADRFDHAVPDLPWRSPFGRHHRLRDVAVDVTMIVIALALSLTSAEGVLHGRDGHPVWLRVADVVLALAGYVAVFWRRRFPLTFAVYVCLVGTFSTSISGLTVVAIFTVAVHRRWPTAAAVLLLSMLCTWPYVELYHLGSDLSFFLAAAVLTFAITAWGMFIRARRELVATLRERAEQAEASRAEHADRARRAERQRIAREMHDVLAHRLSLLSVHAGALEFRPDAPAAEVAEAAGVIRANSHEALTELRSVVRLLREDGEQIAPPQPMLADLPALLDEARSGGTPVSVQTALALEDVPVTVGRTVYRITQEGLTNARKHAPGSAVTVTLEGSHADGVTVRIDSPLPVDRRPAPPGSGSGLIGLRERAELAGGRLEHRITARGHFELTSWLPWTEPS